MTPKQIRKRRAVLRPEYIFIACPMIFALIVWDFVRTREDNYWKLCLFLFGVVIFFGFLSEKKILEYGDCVEGKIVRIERYIDWGFLNWLWILPFSNDYIVTVSYDYLGESRFGSTRSYKAFREGQKVTVYLNPSEPNKCLIFRRSAFRLIENK